MQVDENGGQCFERLDEAIASYPRSGHRSSSHSYVCTFSSTWLPSTVHQQKVSRPNLHQGNFTFKIKFFSVFLLFHAVTLKKFFACVFNEWVFTHLYQTRIHRDQILTKKKIAVTAIIILRWQWYICQTFVHTRILLF